MVLLNIIKNKKIKKDIWLPVNNAGHVLSPIFVPSKNATVDQLFDGEARWWNSNLIDQNFLPFRSLENQVYSHLLIPSKGCSVLKAHK